MYIPPHFRAESDDLVQKIIRENPFATLITSSDEDLKITHLPILFDPTKGQRGIVQAHMAKANPHWRSFAAGAESVVIVMGPHAYVSSTWYTPDTHVSTWNYAAIHLHGRPSILDRDQSIRFLEELVVVFESEQGAYDLASGREAMERQVGGIVAFEMAVEKIEAKFKLSQNRPNADRRSVIERLSRSESGGSVADLMESLYGQSEQVSPLDAPE